MNEPLEALTARVIAVETCVAMLAKALNINGDLATMLQQLTRELREQHGFELDGSLLAKLTRAG